MPKGSHLSPLGNLKRSSHEDARFEVSRYVCEPYVKGSSPVPGYYWLYNVIPGPIMAHLYELLKGKPMSVSYLGIRASLSMLWRKYPKALLFPIPLPDLTQFKQSQNLSE